MPAKISRRLLPLASFLQSGDYVCSAAKTDTKNEVFAWIRLETSINIDVCPLHRRAYLDFFYNFYNNPMSLVAASASFLAGTFVRPLVKPLAIAAAACYYLGMGPVGYTTALVSGG